VLPGAILETSHHFTLFSLKSHNRQKYSQAGAIQTLQKELNLRKYERLAQPIANVSS